MMVALYLFKRGRLYLLYTTHGNDVFIDEYFTVITPIEALTQVLIVFCTIDGFGRFTVETQDIRDHPVEHGTEQVAALGKKRVQIIAIIFETGILTFDAETHLSLLDIDLEIFQ